MKNINVRQMYPLFATIIGAAVMIGCSLLAPPAPPGGDTAAPAVILTFPYNAATGVSVNGTVTATFNEAMTGTTITGANFTLMAGVIAVTGTVTYDIPNKTAIFAPSANLGYNTVYTATVMTGAKDLAGNGLPANKVWTFTTALAGVGPSPVNLGTAGNYVILAKTSVSNIPTSAVTGDIGISPAAETYLTGFSQTDATGYATAPQVTGYLYAADMAPPTPINLTTAVTDMQTAYTDAAGRSSPNFVNLGAGTIGGLTLSPGLYTWGTDVTVPTDITISGNANDVWIFQISGNLTVANAVQVIMSGGARAKNVFWQVAGQAILGTTSHFEGIILCQTAIIMETNATMNGRVLAQSQVTLDHTSITQPAP